LTKTTRQTGITNKTEIKRMRSSEVEKRINEISDISESNGNSVLRVEYQVSNGSCEPNEDSGTNEINENNDMNETIGFSCPFLTGVRV